MCLSTGGLIGIWNGNITVAGNIWAENNTAVQGGKRSIFRDTGYSQYAPYSATARLYSSPTRTCVDETVGVW